MEAHGVAALLQATALAILLVLGACNAPPPIDPSQQLIDRGSDLFFNETFAFNDSPAGRFLAGSDPQGVGIRLDATQVIAVAAFLRVLNALENTRESLMLLEDAGNKGFLERRLTRELLGRASVETNDGIRVLSNAGLHPLAVAQLELAQAQIDEAGRSAFRRSERISNAIDALRKACAELVEAS